ncbi:MAG: DUF4157 domain-containing protein [Bacteroidota bacterium]
MPVQHATEKNQDARNASLQNSGNGLLNQTNLSGGQAQPTNKAQPATPALQMNPQEPESTEQLDMKSETGNIIQLTGNPAGDDDNSQEIIQLSGGNGDGFASPQVESGIQNSKGGGSPLPNDVVSEMGNKIGADFSNVRTHTDSNAVQMNQELGAKAFAHQNDIYFNKGQYNPSSPGGKRLLAHELTHTVQQQNNPQIQRDFIENSVSAYLKEQELQKLQEANKYNWHKYYRKKKSYYTRLLEEMKEVSGNDDLASSVKEAALLGSKKTDITNWIVFSKLVKEVQTKLKDKGYPVKTNDGKLDRNTIAQMRKAIAKTSHNHDNNDYSDSTLKNQVSDRLEKVDIDKINSDIESIESNKENSKILEDFFKGDAMYSESSKIQKTEQVDFIISTVKKLMKQLVAIEKEITAISSKRLISKSEKDRKDKSKYIQNPSEYKKYYEGSPEVREAKNKLQATIRRLLKNLSAKGSNYKTAYVEQFKAKTYRKLTRFVNYSTQLANFNYLPSGGTKAWTRTCNVSTLAMTLELLGKSAKDFTGDKKVMVKIGRSLDAYLINYDRIAALPLDDFLQLVVMYQQDAAAVKKLEKNIGRAKETAIALKLQSGGARNNTSLGRLRLVAKLFGGKELKYIGPIMSFGKKDRSTYGDVKDNRKKLSRLQKVEKKTAEQKKEIVALQNSLKGFDTKTDRYQQVNKKLAKEGITIKKYRKQAIATYGKYLNEGYAVGITRSKGSHGKPNAEDTHTGHYMFLVDVNEKEIVVMDPFIEGRKTSVSWDRAWNLGYFAYGMRIK